MKKILIILFIFRNLLFSQIDTLDALRYYPLAVGNKWQYARYDYLGNFERYSTTGIVKDTILPNGYRYFVSSNNRYIRIDTSEVAVYYYSIHSGFDTLEFKLGITEFDTTPCHLGIMNNFYIGSGQVGELPYTTKYKFYEYLWLDEYHQYKLSKDIGLSFTRSAYVIQPWCYVERLLVAAQIGDTVYGQFVSIEPEIKTVTSYTLHQNYPNPFNLTTTIQYAISKKSHVILTIYNIAGQALEVLENQSKEPGYYLVQWDASKVGSGIYLYEIKAGDPSSGSPKGQARHGFRDVKKCVIIK